MQGQREIQNGDKWSKFSCHFSQSQTWYWDNIKMSLRKFKPRIWDSSILCRWDTWLEAGMFTGTNQTSFFLESHGFSRASSNSLQCWFPSFLHWSFSLWLNLALIPASIRRDFHDLKQVYKSLGGWAFFRFSLFLLISKYLILILDMA